MRNDEDMAWKERGASLSNLKAAHRGKSYPSRWRLLQFAVRQVYLKGWLFSPIIGALARISSGRGAKKAHVRNGEELPISSPGNLGDIRVQVKVDVESCYES